MDISNTKVYVMRHAEIEYPLDKKGNRLMYPPETHISQNGRDQFRAFVKQLREKGIKIDVIESSGYTRALESAEILSEETGGARVVANLAFADSYIPGYIGLPLSLQQELMDKGQDIYMNPLSSDQEQYDHIAQRMLDGFRDLARRNEGKTVAIVSHGDPIRLLMYRLEHPEGKIPNMSILSKENYLKRGEAFYVEVDQEGKILEKQLLSNLEGTKGLRETY